MDSSNAEEVVAAVTAAAAVGEDDAAVTVKTPWKEGMQSSNVNNSMIDATACWREEMMEPLVEPCCCRCRRLENDSDANSSDDSDGGGITPLYNNICRSI